MSVFDVFERLRKWSEKWVYVAGLLGLPASVISAINILTSHQPDMGDEGALHKVIEWWFVNSANPEWTAIDDVLKHLAEGMFIHACLAIYTHL